MEIIIGFTETDRAADYVPAMDGYRPGAAQTLHTISAADDPDVTPEQWAEAVYMGTNIPRGELRHDYPGADAVTQAVTRSVADGTTAPGDWRSLSIGDTVTVDGETWACVRAGFELVAYAWPAELTHEQAVDLHARMLDRADTRCGSGRALAAVIKAHGPALRRLRPDLPPVCPGCSNTRPILWHHCATVRTLAAALQTRPVTRELARS